MVDKAENCYPMIPSGKPHNQMLLGDQDEEEKIIKFVKFQGQNKLKEFLDDIINSSFVLGFLPILCFFFITLKEPTFFKFKLPDLIFLIIIFIKSLISFFAKFEEKPLLLFKLFIILIFFNCCLVTF